MIKGINDYNKASLVRMVILWIAALVAATGAALTIMGALSGSVLMACLGIAAAVSPGVVWVIWVLMLVISRLVKKAVHAGL